MEVCVFLFLFKVDGGTTLSISMTWSQKLRCSAGNLTLNVPFTFPEYVIPAGKKMSKKEKIELNVNVGSAAEVLCKTMSHPLKVCTLMFRVIDGFACCFSL